MSLIKAALPFSYSSMKKKSERFGQFLKNDFEYQNCADLASFPLILIFKVIFLSSALQVRSLYSRGPSIVLSTRSFPVFIV